MNKSMASPMDSDDDKESEVIDMMTKMQFLKIRFRFIEIKLSQRMQS